MKLLFTSILVAASFLLTACTASPAVPADAKVVFHGPITDMTGAWPVGPGTIYVVDSSSGKVKGVTYLSGAGSKGEERHAAPINGLKQGKTYTLYYLAEDKAS